MAGTVESTMEQDAEQIASILENETLPTLDTILAAYAGSMPKGIRRDLERIQSAVEHLFVILQRDELADYA